MDSITAEEIAAAGEEGVDIMFALCSKIWKEERVPDEWKHSIIVPIHKTCTYDKKKKKKKLSTAYGEEGSGRQ